MFDFDSILCWFLFCSIFNTIIPTPKCCILLINNLINSNGSLLKIDSQSGKILWDKEIFENLENSILGAPAISGKYISENDVTIFATGHLVWEALEAAKTLESEGISAEVINLHTIKPLDNDAILKAVANTKCVVTAEEHMLNGGLGDSIAQLLSRKNPTPIEMVAMDDSFGESGPPMKLMEKYGIDRNAIIESAKKVITRK